ncbi:propanediol utilization protein PduL [Klebsiella pneumoniae]|jgi:phosphate propanoyltransferase|uniref:Propanediol utilization protein PduL n=1 Tax=Klebsiella pneumoniae TaxID=573 RepID=A0A2X3CE54_KLEPN|nr:propanediol utilization protein PduL [Klebsiella pneumoniae]STT30668.1 propanediol utilization protein PduL [Klebsiella pneumoniae]
MDKQQLASTVNKVLDEMRQRPIPIGISSRHIHLAAADYARLFPAQPIQPKKRCCSRDNMLQSRR